MQCANLAKKIGDTIDALGVDGEPAVKLRGFFASAARYISAMRASNACELIECVLEKQRALSQGAKPQTPTIARFARDIYAALTAADDQQREKYMQQEYTLVKKLLYRAPGSHVPGSGAPGSGAPGSGAPGSGAPEGRAFSPTRIAAYAINRILARLPETGKILVCAPCAKALITVKSAECDFALPDLARWKTARYATIIINALNLHALAHVFCYAAGSYCAYNLAAFVMIIHDSDTILSHQYAIATTDLGKNIALTLITGSEKKIVSISDVVRMT